VKDKLVSAYHRVIELGLMHQATGNLSCRVDDGMLISCSGANANDFGPEHVVRVDNDGNWDGDLRPSSEWRMHHSIYERCENANAVVHTHSDYCVALACNNQPLPGFHYMVGTFGGRDVPCVPYSTFGTEKLAADAANALRDRAACLLGNHGMICRGRDFDTAVANAERLEVLCRQYWLARQLGEPDILTDEQWEAFFERARDMVYNAVE
jgi:L-fuculose-phosphate aldolase